MRRSVGLFLKIDLFTSRPENLPPQRDGNKGEKKHIGLNIRLSKGHLIPSSSLQVAKKKMKGSLLLLQSRIFGLGAVRRLVNLLEGDSSRAGRWCDLAAAQQPRATRAFHFNLCGSISNISLLKKKPIRRGSGVAAFVPSSCEGSPAGREGQRKTSRQTQRREKYSSMLAMSLCIL